MGYFQKRPERVWAEQFLGEPLPGVEFDPETRQAYLSVQGIWTYPLQPGDWVVHDREGHYTVFSNTLFQAVFVPLTGADGETPENGST